MRRPSVSPANSVLVIGTAPVMKVSKCILDFHSIFDDHIIHVLIKREIALDVGIDVVVHPFSGIIHWHRLSLFFVFRRLRPTRMIIVCNDAFSHGNVLNAVLFWSRLCRHTPRISVFTRNCLLFDGLRGTINDSYIDF